MSARRKPAIVLAMLAMALSACSSGSAAAPGTATVTTTVTGGTPSASPPHIVVTPSGGGSPSTAGMPRCDGPSLVVSVGGGEGAAGTIFYRIVFTNRSSGSCYLQGFPGVAAADSAGTAKVDAKRDPSTKPTRVVLAAGRSAHASLGVRNVPPGSSACPSYPLLLVTPADSRRTSTLSQRVSPCATQMRITVVQPGAA